MPATRTRGDTWLYTKAADIIYKTTGQGAGPTTQKRYLTTPTQYVCDRKIDICYLARETYFTNEVKKIVYIKLYNLYLHHLHTKCYLATENIFYK